MARSQSSRLAWIGLARRPFAGRAASPSGLGASQLQPRDSQRLSIAFGHTAAGRRVRLGQPAADAGQPSAADNRTAVLLARNPVDRSATQLAASSTASVDQIGSPAG